MNLSIESLQHIQTELDDARRRIASLEQQLAQSTGSSDQESRIFRYLAERGTEVIVLLDEQGTVTYVSPSIIPAMGYSVEEYSRHYPE
jgi:PAS domain-containing protein